MGLWTKLTRPSARGSWFKHTFTLSSYFDFHFQFVEAGSITLSHFHHTLTFTFSPWQLVQHTLSHFHHTLTFTQFVEAGSITLSHFHHTLTFTLSPSARGSWINQITITNSIQCILLTAKLVILVILSSSWFTFTFQNRSPLNGEVTFEATNWSKIFSQVPKLLVHYCTLSL